MSIERISKEQTIKKYDESQKTGKTCLCPKQMKLTSIITNNYVIQSDTLFQPIL